MRCLILTLCFLAGMMVDSVAQYELHHRVKIWTPPGSMPLLSSLGIETDHGDIRKNVWLVSDFSESELAQIAAAGFRYDILISDVTKHYQSQSFLPEQHQRTQAAAGCFDALNNYPVPAAFNLGNYAGYYYYQEMLNILDSMQAQFPALITIKQALPGGTTINGEPVYYVKISDNVLVDENEPEVLYTAVHHAREPGGMSQLIYYMWYLLENYGSDPEIDAILNNTELFFIPCLNPDGYLFNEMNEPAGGGMWRKNRRDNLDGTFGVDLNRNYGFNWGFDDSGSSPNTNSSTYRGTNPFSEPETQLIRDFINTRQFLIALNYHTYGNLLIYPWGYDYSIYTPDSALLSNYGNLLTTQNGYTFGTADQTVGYIVNGSSDDWMYGEQTSKPKILAMTPECGDAALGFWPAASEIIPLCQQNMFQNITAAQLAGRYARFTETSPTLVSTGGGYVTFELTQLGLDTSGTYTVSLTAITPNVFMTGNAVSVSNLQVLQTITDSISFALTTPMTHGEEIRFLLAIDNGQYVRTDTITKIFGPVNMVFSSDGNSISGWTPATGSWGVSNTIYYSPTGSITDSPVGDYGSNEFKICRIVSSVNLTNSVYASLSFYARWAIEPNFDYVQLQASTNNGSTWTALCGKYTVPGSAFQQFEEPLYEGYQFGWVKEEVNLSDYLGQTIQLRFVLSSDNFSEYDGFYFDDFLVTKILPGTNSLDEQPLNEIGLSIIPNPAGMYTYINFDKQVADASVRITDVLGKLVQQIPVDNGSASLKLDTSNYVKGIYLVQLKTGNMLSAPVKLVIR